MEFDVRSEELRTISSEGGCLANLKRLLKFYYRILRMKYLLAIFLLEILLFPFLGIDAFLFIGTEDNFHFIMLIPITVYAFVRIVLRVWFFVDTRINCEEPNYCLISTIFLAELLAFGCLGILSYGFQ